MIQTISIIDICNLILKKWGAESALELGCGICGMISRLHLNERRVGIDNWQPSLDEAREKFPFVKTICADIRRVGELFVPSSIDIVCGFDILEHLLYADAMQVMDAAERIARKGVIWWGPLEEDEPRDIETHGNPGMKHIRIINLNEFETRDYELITFPHYWTELPMYGATGFLAFKGSAQ